MKAWFTALGAGVLLVVGLPVAASAQPAAGSFHELQHRVKIGDIVYVIDASGLETRGTLTTLSSTSLGLAVDGSRRDFAAGAIARVDGRQRDSVRNGVLIGIGGGALLGFFVGRAADSPNCPPSGGECGQGALVGTLGGALWGGLGGWLLDALIPTRDVIYRAPPNRQHPSA